MRKMDFVDNPRLKRRIENVLEDVLELSGLHYAQKKSNVKSCLRKTMIIYIASVIEALLLWKLNKEVKAGRVNLDDEMKYLKPQKINETGRLTMFIVKGKKEKRKPTDFNFSRLIDVCAKHGIIKDERVILMLHEVRKTRNEQHIGGIKAIRKKYGLFELTYAFAALEETIKAVQ